MASGVSQVDLKREKLKVAVYFGMLLIAFQLVFQPIHRVRAKQFSDVAFTYRFEKPVGTSEKVKRELKDSLTKSLSDFIDAHVTFPTTNELRVRVSLEERKEVKATASKLEDLVVKATGTKYGKVTDTVIDDAAFGDDPKFMLVGGYGVFTPKLHLRWGLDLQGGVQLVLKARTQNTQFEYKLSTSADELRKIAETDKPKADAPAATDDKAKDAAGKPAEKAADKAADKPTEKTGDKAAEKTADKPAAKATDKPAEKAGDKADKAKDAAKPGETKKGKSPDGGQPLRLAQAPKDADKDDAKDEPKDDAKDKSKSKSKDAKDAKDGDEKEEAANLSDNEAKLLADDDLRQKVNERINQWADELRKTTQVKAYGELDVETVGTNVIVIRTLIDPGLKAAVKKETAANQQAFFLKELQQLFPKAVSLGDPKEMIIPTNAIAQVKDVISRRVDKLGVAEAQVSTQGTDRVAVQLPGIKDPDEAMRMLGTTARLEFRRVPDNYEPEPHKGAGGKETTTFHIKGQGGKAVPTDVVYYEAPEFKGNKNILVGSDLKANNVTVGFDQAMKPTVNLQINSAGARRFDEFAADSYHKYLAIYLDREVISAPRMNARSFNGQVQISGGFENTEEANALRILLNAGALPVPVDVVEQRTVSATLGADAVRQSGIAGLIGTLLILLMMCWRFKLSGLLADLALVFYITFTLASLQVVQATITLPGILGLLLSIGMAVDANVIVFERLKEELRAFPNRPMMASLNHAYDRSWNAILDGNVTCFMMGIVLYALGTGPIRGFAVTLILGIFCHLFTALLITRSFQALLAAAPVGQSHRAYRT